MRRLAGQSCQFFKDWRSGIVKTPSVDNAGTDLEQSNTQTVTPSDIVALHETVREKRGEEAMDRALGVSESLGELSQAKVLLVGRERFEHAENAICGLKHSRDATVAAFASHPGRGFADGLAPNSRARRERSRSPRGIRDSDEPLPAPRRSAALPRSH
jgi:hypothetical protein